MQGRIVGCNYLFILHPQVIIPGITFLPHSPADRQVVAFHHIPY